MRLSQIVLFRQLRQSLPTTREKSFCIGVAIMIYGRCQEEQWTLVRVLEKPLCERSKKKPDWTQDRNILLAFILIPNTSSHFLTVRCVNSSRSVSIVRLLAEKYGQAKSLTRLLSFPPRKSNI